MRWGIWQSDHIKDAEKVFKNILGNKNPKPMRASEMQNLYIISQSVSSLLVFLTLI